MIVWKLPLHSALLCLALGTGGVTAQQEGGGGGGGLSFQIPGTDININLGGSDSDSDGNGTSSSSSSFNLGDIDFNAILEDASEFIGQSFANITLPDNLEDLFTLPNFENITFSFGGNCTLCDSNNGSIDETLDLEGVKCSDWAVISSLGIREASRQCVLLRAAAVQSCGCPMPEEHSGKTCDVCPEGQEISTTQGTFPDTVGVTCDDLVNLPAVDGDFTCRAVLDFQEPCGCRTSTGEQGTTTNTGEPSSTSNESSASARELQNKYYLFAGLALLGAVAFL